MKGMNRAIIGESTAALVIAAIGFVAAAGSGLGFTIAACVTIAACLLFDIVKKASFGRNTDRRNIGEDTIRAVVTGAIGLAAGLGLTVFHGLVYTYILILLVQEALLLLAVFSGSAARRTWTSALFRYTLLLTIILASLEGTWSFATQASTGAQLLLTPVSVLSLGHSIWRAARSLGRHTRTQSWVLRTALPFVTILTYLGAVTYLALDNFVVIDETPEFAIPAQESGQVDRVFTTDRWPFGADSVTNPATIQGVDARRGTPSSDDWVSAEIETGTLVLGPVLGAIDEKSISIWVATEQETHLTVLVKEPTGSVVARVPLVSSKERDMTGVAHITDLSPRASYVYDIVDESGASVLPASLLPWCRFTTFPEKTANAALRFMVASCHRPLAESEDYYSGSFVPERFVMWEAFSRQTHIQPVDFMLLLGDQIYNDEPFEKNLPDTEEWEKLKTDSTYRIKRENEIRKDFRDNYIKYWSHPSMRKVMASVPSFMIWDDHETRDGWGSEPQDAKDEATRWLAGLAAIIDDEFQGYARPANAGSARWFSFRFGSTAFFVPDLRSERNAFGPLDEFPLMGAKQWEAIETWFETDAIDAKHIFLGMSVPMADAPGWVIDWLAKDRSGLGDDFRDKWYYNANRPEMVRILDRLFDWQKTTGGRAFTLGGDAHIALLGRFGDRRLPLGDPARDIFELTASGISNDDSTAQISYFLFKTFFGKTWMGEWYQSQVLKIVNRLNYGIVEVLPPGMSVRGGPPAPAGKPETRFWIAEELPEGKGEKTGIQGSPESVLYHLFLTTAGSESLLAPGTMILDL